MVIYYYIILTALGFFGHVIFVTLFKRINAQYKFLSLGNVPLIGGLSMGLSFVMVCSLVFLAFGQALSGVMHITAASFVMLIFGVVDDWRELSIRDKFIMQAIATSLLIYFGVRTRIFDITTAANILITFVWVIGITNAFNHLDIMDGLASGTAMIVSLSLFIISGFNNDIRSATLSLVLFAVNASYLMYNLPPAKIYMGNTGSHFLGFVLAATAIAVSYATFERKLALFSPLLILGLPIFDTVFLIVARAGKGKLPFLKSNDHIALRLLGMGYSKKKTLFYMMAINAAFCLAGIALSRVGNTAGFMIILAAMIMSLAITCKMLKAKHG